MSTTFAPYYPSVYPNIRPHPPTYSPLSSGLPSPSFGPIQLPRGRSPTPATSRQPSRQQSIRRFSSISRHPSTAAVPRTPALFDHLDFSAIADDILSEGDIIGQGDILHGESIELVHIPTSAARSDPPPAAHFRVVRKLGAGSYAVVYLVKEITSITPIPGDDDILSDTEGPSTRYHYTYGREFAVKCLSKASLSPEELVVQMFEATLHQALPSHPNIVTLHRTLQTRSFLLLVLEWVPGEDLFYFLEQSRDHQPHSMFEDVMMNMHPTSSGRSVASRNAHPTSVSDTPPTPSLLSTLHPNHVLSYQRLRLISSMVAQMCDAVDACHARGVSHRDIKPENFIVTEGTREQGDNSGSERKVLVKLTDFGLATLQQESSDVDCGSAPYMSYECRNNVAPTYATQPADVWSLGIVLINMLYHHNPWSDTSIYYSPDGSASGFSCPSFAAFLSSPVPFFLQRFPGMTLPVAEFLATRVFCLLPPPGTSPNPRVTAREFGDWVKNLPQLLGQGPPKIDRRVSKLSFSQLAGEDWDHRVIEASPLPPVTDGKADTGDVVVVVDESSLPEPLPPNPVEIDASGDPTSVSPHGDDDKRSIRSASTKRRGKRGGRKKHVAPSDGSVSQHDEHLDSMAAGVGSLARQISSQTTPSSRVTTRPSSSSMMSTTSSTITARSRKSGKSSTERALARMPPAPSIPPPAPPPTPGSSGVGRSLALAKMAGKSVDSFHSSLSWQGSTLPPLPGSPTEEQPPQKAPSELEVPQPPHATSSPMPISPSMSSKSLPVTSTTFASANPTLTPKKSWRERLGLKDGGHASSSSSSLAESVGAVPPTGRSTARPPQFGIPDLSGTVRRQASSTSLGKSLNGSSTHLAPVPEVSSPPSSSNLAENVRNIISTLEPAPPKSSAKAIPTPRSHKDDRGRPLAHDDVDGSDGRRQPHHGSRWQEPSPRRNQPPSPFDSISPRRHQNAPSISGFSMASSHAGTASSASSTYTRFSNSSLRSVSTANTSLSGGSSHYMRAYGQYGDKPSDQQSWRSSESSDAGEPRPRPRKPAQRTNVKRIGGIPWELDELPRQSHPRINGVLPQGHIHGAPPERKKAPALRPASAQSNVLGTINERQTASSPLAISSHEEESSTANDTPSSASSQAASSGYDPQKKGVQKGQVNSLGKLLLSLKR